jgi:UDP-N-acetyl-D-galactosamine dehydrogenase
MNLYQRICNGSEKIAVVGLGYVGMPLAIAFAKKVEVVAFDISTEKIQQYKNGIDVTQEVGDDAVRESSAFFTDNEEHLKQARFFIVAVPTPINDDKTPDLSLVESACAIVGRNLSAGSIVVFESTVYPGVTEEICMPILEAKSGLSCGKDFKVGYSPERINPGDKLHRLENIVKLVSGMDDESLDIIAGVYELVALAGVYRAESIKTAEAAKVIENSQRDINIAFMNELSIIFSKMGIDTKSVLQAAGTKWNFINFTPGLVGGHCIGVDPYYLTYKAEQLGYHSRIILAGRTINDDMGAYVAEQTVKQMIKAGVFNKEARVAVFGVTFKENCPDVRNSKVFDITRELADYGIECIVTDPIASQAEVWSVYGLKTVGADEIDQVDACIFAVTHSEYKAIRLEGLTRRYRSKPYVLMDLKGLFDKKQALGLGYSYWRL